MKLVSPLLAMVAIHLTFGCVSRTTTVEKGYGENVSQKEIIWIWQKEYRQDRK
jgi:hypothetical protein